ncbi:MAG: T9SS type A sorting domain-containing protein [Ignavibacteriales bacterium]|nr:T9SS type A sorting domain-containing protein [Ignavibacteriales bacterium]
MKKFIYSFLVFTMSVTIFCQTEIQVSPLSEEFLNYVNNPSSVNYGNLPHPTKVVVTVPDGYKPNMVLPAAFDLRTGSYMTSVKDQGTCGSCWAFTSMAAVESRMIRKGVGTYDLSENNLNYGHGFVWTPCSGGNAYLSTAYFARLDGPVSETDDPYQGSGGSYHPGLTPQLYVSEWRILPDNATTIKQMCYDYGAIYTNMFWYNTSYNSGNKTYYWGGSSDSGTNHAVTIAGWDDSKVTAGGTGAWLIKNSWGTGWGDNGYFWISYNDNCVNSSVSYWHDAWTYNSNIRVHGYDKLGWVGGLGYGSPYIQAYGLVKFVFSENQYITKIGTYAQASNSQIAIEIYDSFNGSSLSTLLGSIGTQTVTYPGFYTFNLTTPISVSSGGDVYVKIYYYTPGYNYPCPTEYYVAGYSNPTIETGKCWLSYDATSGNWTPIGQGTSFAHDVCAKLYCVTSLTDIDEQGNNIPNKFRLEQNYPNPFNPTTTIKYSVPENSMVKIKVYDVIGKEVATLVNEEKSVGNYSVEFDAANLTSGIYFYKLITENYIETKKMILIK